MMPEPSYVKLNRAGFMLLRLVWRLKPVTAHQGCRRAVTGQPGLPISVTFLLTDEREQVAREGLGDAGLQK